jgi:hypothetical protein
MESLPTNGNEKTEKSTEAKLRQNKAQKLRTRSKKGNEEEARGREGRWSRRLLTVQVRLRLPLWSAQLLQPLQLAAATERGSARREPQLSLAHSEKDRGQGLRAEQLILSRGALATHFILRTPSQRTACPARDLLGKAKRSRLASNFKQQLRNQYKQSDNNKGISQQIIHF